MLRILPPNDVLRAIYRKRYGKDPTFTELEQFKKNAPLKAYITGQDLETLSRSRGTKSW